MHSLFVDTTLGLDVGLLDSDYTWVEYLSLDEKKPSEIIHHEIYNLLKKYDLNLEDMQCFISSGPGSYTGMRLSEGFAQVFELYKIPVYSFYHFNVPKLSGIKKGFWATNAFKGQVFVYNWQEDTDEQILINKDLFKLEAGKSGFTLDTNDILFSSLTSTKKMIFNGPHLIFEKIKNEKLRMQPFYFRSLDEEFKKC